MIDFDPPAPRVAAEFFASRREALDRTSGEQHPAQRLDRAGCFHYLLLFLTILRDEIWPPSAAYMP